MKVVRLRASGSTVNAASFVVGEGRIGMMYVPVAIPEGMAAVPASDGEAAACEQPLERYDALVLRGGDKEVLLDLSGDAVIFLLTVPRRPGGFHTLTLFRRIHTFEMARTAHTLTRQKGPAEGFDLSQLTDPRRPNYQLEAEWKS